jgi:uncharacterized protein (DUF2147 family)
MRNSLILAATAAAMLTLPAHADHADGVWKTETNDKGAYLEVEIAPCAADAGLTCGVIVNAVNATDPSVVGRSIIENMVHDGADRFSGGTIWAPDDDKTYSSKMELAGGVLKVSGCVFGGLVCRGQDWTPVQ